MRKRWRRYMRVRECAALWYHGADSVASCFPRCTCLFVNWHKCTMLPRCGRLRLFRFIPPSSHHRQRHTSCNLPRCLRTVLVTMSRATSQSAVVDGRDSNTKQTAKRPPHWHAEVHLTCSTRVILGSPHIAWRAAGWHLSNRKALSIARDGSS